MLGGTVKQERNRMQIDSNNPETFLCILWPTALYIVLLRVPLLLSARQQLQALMADKSGFDLFTVIYHSSFDNDCTLVLKMAQLAISAPTKIK